MSFQDVDDSPYSPSNPVKLNPRKALNAGVFKMVTEVARFRRMVDSLGTRKDTIEFREKLNSHRQTLSRLAKETTNYLKMTSIDDHKQEINKKTKLEDAKIAKDFQSVLLEYQSLQKLSAEKESKFQPIQKLHLLNASSEATALPNAREREHLLQQEMMTMEDDVIYNQAVIEEREEEIKQVQHQIVEVNEMFRDIAVLVKEQGGQIDDIESNIQSSKASAERGNKHLNQAEKSLNNSNSIACWILVVFGIAIFIFVVVLSL